MPLNILEWIVALCFEDDVPLIGLPLAAEIYGAVVIARALAKTKAFEISRRERKRVEMLFVHLKRILRLGRLRLRGPYGAQVEFTLAAVAKKLRRLAKLIARPPPAVDACLA